MVLAADVHRRPPARVPVAPQQVDPSIGTPTWDPDTMTWTAPTYGGSDPGFAAWLSGANVQAANAKSTAKLRKAQYEESYRQALQDLDKQSTFGRRNLQTSLLQRGVFQSGEADRRKQEFDAGITQAQQRALGSLTSNEGSLQDQERTTLANLSSQGATQVSQAMLRDALAQYNQQQQAAAQVAAPAQQAPQPQQAPAPQAVAAPAPAPGNVFDSQSLYRKAAAPKAPVKQTASAKSSLVTQRKVGLQ